MQRATVAPSCDKHAGSPHSAPLSSTAGRRLADCGNEGTRAGCRAREVSARISKEPVPMTCQRLALFTALLVSPFALAQNSQDQDPRSRGDDRGRKVVT